MHRFALMIFCLMGLAACSAPAKSRETLTKAGYTEIEITGWDAFECGQDDTFSTGFTAKNPLGLRVSGTVCCGLFVKGCTIRF